MNQKPPCDPAIATMPRGGPAAGWLDRRMQTARLEYTDRYDVPDELKQGVVIALGCLGTRLGVHENSAKIALGLALDVLEPRILELGAGHGELSEAILRMHPGARVTVSDLDPISVANIAAGDLGTHPRARVQVIDATAIDAEDNSYDLVVLAQAFHHLPPDTAVAAIAEATRVGQRFLVIDHLRQSSSRLLAMSLLAAPVNAVVRIVRPSLTGLVHDGFISMLRAYGPPAFTALGRAADPAMNIRFLGSPFQSGPPAEVVIYSRPRTTTVADSTRACAQPGS